MLVSSGPCRSLLVVSMMLALVACGPSPKQSAFFNRGGPESLLDVSSEVVNLSIDSPIKLKELSAWIAKDKPTRAELYCMGSDPRCGKAESLLREQSVVANIIPSSDNSVALIYERIVARDCDQRFVDNNSNHYNEPHPSFGCAISANIVQHVSNKREFVNPNLSDAPSAIGGVNAVNRLYTPRTEVPQGYTVNNPLSTK